MSSKRTTTDTAVIDQEETTIESRQSVLCVPLGRGSRGKTTFARWAAEQAISEGRAVTIVDCDRTNQELALYFKDVMTPPSADDNDVREFLAAILERQLEDKTSLILDLGGGDLILKSLAREMELVPFVETVWHSSSCCSPDRAGPSRSRISAPR
jgi:hypothetical protein